MVDLSEFGTTSGTSVITRRDGTKEYYQDGKLVQEQDSSGTPVIRININPETNETTSSSGQSSSTVANLRQEAEYEQSVREYEAAVQEQKDAATQYTQDVGYYVPTKDGQLYNPTRIQQERIDRLIQETAPVKPQESFLRQNERNQALRDAQIDQARESTLKRFGNNPVGAVLNFGTSKPVREFVESGKAKDTLKYAVGGSLLLAPDPTGITKYVGASIIVPQAATDVYKSTRTDYEKEILNSPQFDSIVTKGYQAEAKQKGFFEGFAFDLNPAFSSKNDKSVFVDTIRQEYKNLGLSGDKLDKAVLTTYRYRQTANIGEGVGQIAIGGAAEKTGRVLVTKAGYKYGVTKGFKNLVQTTFNPISKAGYLEGAGSVYLAQEYRTGKVNAKDVLGGAAIGGLTAGATSGVIRATNSKIVLGASYVADPTELPSDSLTDVFKKRRVISPTKVSTITLSNPLTKTKTTLQEFQGASTISAAQTPSTVAAFTSSKTVVPTFAQQQVPVQPQIQQQVPVQPQTQVPVQPQTQVPVQPQPNVPVQPQTQVPVQPQTQVPVQPQVPVQTPTFTFRKAIPFLPLISRRGGGGGSFRINRKKATKQVKAYTPSSFAAGFGIKGKASKIGTFTGLGGRPITETQNAQSYNNSAYVSTSALNIRLDTKQFVEELKLNLSGEILEAYEKEDGTFGLKPVKIGEARANKIGIQALLSFVNSHINTQVVQGNYLDEEMYYLTIDYVEDALRQLLIVNAPDWDIKTENIIGIYQEIINAIMDFKTRLLFNEERESYAATMKHVESNTISPQKNSLFPFKD